MGEPTARPQRSNEFWATFFSSLLFNWSEFGPEDNFLWALCLTSSLTPVIRTHSAKICLSSRSRKNKFLSLASLNSAPWFLSRPYSKLHDSVPGKWESDNLSLCHFNWAMLNLPASLILNSQQEECVQESRLPRAFVHLLQISWVTWCYLKEF